MGKMNIIANFCIIFVLNLHVLPMATKSTAMTEKSFSKCWQFFIGKLGPLLQVKPDGDAWKEDTADEQVGSTDDKENIISTGSAQLTPRAEWRLMAMVLDRLLLGVFSLVVVVMAIVLGCYQ